MTNNFKSLLPRTSSKLERALEQACAERCDSMNLNLHDLYDADRCPLELLPFLAWAFHAPSWSANWTEAQKRQAIKDAVIINRRKGTGWAVRMALSTANITAELVEWWQDSPSLGSAIDSTPYTFSTRIWLNDQIPGAFGQLETYGRLIEIVEEYKNVRSSFDLRIGAKFTLAQRVALATSMHATSSQQATTVPVPLRDSAITIAPHIATSMHATANQQANAAPVPLRPVAPKMGVHVGVQFRATMILGAA